jgi:hypothetical protein
MLPVVHRLFSGTVSAQRKSRSLGDGLELNFAMKQRIDRTLLMWLVALVVLAGILLYLVWAGADVDPPFWKEGVSNVHESLLHGRAGARTKLQNEQPPQQPPVCGGVPTSISRVATALGAHLSGDPGSS